MANFIDFVISKNENFLRLHKSTEYKNYVFDMAYKPEQNKIYNIEKIYTVRIRTINKELAQYFYENMRFKGSEYIYCIGGEIKIIPQKIFEKVYTLTPALIKSLEFTNICKSPGFPFKKMDAALLVALPQNSPPAISNFLLLLSIKPTCSTSLLSSNIILLFSYFVYNF